jgi:hypothetical protein
MLGVYDLHVGQPPVLRAHVLCARTPRLPRRAQDGVRLSMPCHLPANVVETASSRTEPSAPRKSCMRFVPCWHQALRSKVAPPFSTTLCGCAMSSLCGEQRILDHIDVDPQHPVFISQCSEQQVRLRARSERRSNLYAGPRNSDGHAKPEVAFSKVHAPIGQPVLEGWRAEGKIALGSFAAAALAMLGGPRALD